MPDQHRVEPDVIMAAGEVATADQPEPTLPEPVRQRVIALAAAAITGMPSDEVPASLRKVAQFAPNRRARLGGPAIAAQLAADLVFRQRIGSRVIESAGDLGMPSAIAPIPGRPTPSTSRR
jgi:hypothetical protein